MSILAGMFAVIILIVTGMLSPTVSNAEDTAVESEQAAPESNPNDTAAPVTDVTSPKEKNWEFNLAPFYLWAVKMDGDMTMMGVTQPMKADFNEITDNLETIFTVHFEGMHKDGLGFLIDYSYLKLNGQETITDPVPATMDVTFKNPIVELAGLYRLNYGKNDLDFIAGIRYYELDADIDIVGTPFNPKGNENWVDEMLGARYIWTITDQMNIMARGDIGVGGSDLTWNLAGLLNYMPRKHLTILAGYRHMNIDYKTGAGANLFEYDMAMSGPVLGLNFAW